jgi:hypothetical protein
VPYILQSYVDNTGDIQTAAYIASYQYVAYQTMPKVKNPNDEVVLKRFIYEYRAFLNRLQLWYIRADFDVAFSTLKKSPIFKQSPQTMDHINEGISSPLEDEGAIIDTDQ